MSVLSTSKTISAGACGWACRKLSTNSRSTAASFRMIFFIALLLPVLLRPQLQPVERTLAAPDLDRWLVADLPRSDPFSLPAPPRTDRAATRHDRSGLRSPRPVHRPAAPPTPPAPLTPHRESHKTANWPMMPVRFLHLAQQQTPTITGDSSTVKAASNVALI